MLHLNVLDTVDIEGIIGGKICAEQDAKRGGALTTGVKLWPVTGVMVAICGCSGCCGSCGMCDMCGICGICGCCGWPGIAPTGAVGSCMGWP